MSKSKRDKFALVCMAALLGAISTRIHAETILSPTLTNGTGCVGSGCITVSGLGTSQVTLVVSASVNGPGSATNSRDFPLYTLGPIVPGTLTLNWTGDFEGSAGSGGHLQGTVWDWETGTPVSAFTWSACGGCGGPTVFLPFNVGIPFSISLQATASASFIPGFSTGGTEFAMARVSVASLPEPANFLLVLSGLAALLAGRMVHRKFAC